MSTVKVLIIEDEIIVAKDLKMGLEKRGYLVCTLAASLQEAASISKSEKPDIAIVDIHIQGNKDGIYVASFLRDQFNIPSIFLTSSSQLETIQKAKGSDPYAYLLKPVNIDMVVSSVEIAMHNHQKSQGMKDNLQKIVQAFNVFDFPVIVLDKQGLIMQTNQKVQETSVTAPSDPIIGLAVDNILGAGFFQKVAEYFRSLADSSLGFVGKAVLRFPSQNVGRETNFRINPFYSDLQELMGYVLELGDNATKPAVVGDDSSSSNSNSGSDTEFPELAGATMPYDDDQVYIIKDKGSYYRIPYKNILYAEALGNYVKFFTATKHYTVLSPISKVEEKLKSHGFIRAHRSFLVSSQAIVAIHGNDLEIHGVADLIPIGKTFKHDIMKIIETTSA